MADMSARLLVSISSIYGDTVKAAEGLLLALDAAEIPVSLLVTPHGGGKWHLAKDKSTRKWLRGQLDTPRDLILNGFDQAAKGRRAEFAKLDEHEAHLRLKGATRQMEAMEFTTDMFAPPRWQLSDGTLAVLPEFGFRLAGSTKGIHDLRSGEFHQCRTLSVGEGYGAAKWWRRNVIKAAERGAAGGNTIRLSVSARKLDSSKVRSDFLSAAHSARDAGAVPMRYSEFL